MTDIELLKQASKAAGYEVCCSVEDVCGYGKGLLIKGRQFPWNPLDEDVDAFDLMIERNVSLNKDDLYVRADTVKSTVFEKVGDDAKKAARRAVVMAVALSAEEKP